MGSMSYASLKLVTKAKKKARYLYSGTEIFTVYTESLILLRFARTAVVRLLLINHPIVLGRGLSWPKLAVHESWINYSR